MSGPTSRAGCLIFQDVAIRRQFEQRPDDPTAPAWSLFLALHPDVTRDAGGKG